MSVIYNNILGWYVSSSDHFRILCSFSWRLLFCYCSSGMGMVIWNSTYTSPVSEEGSKIVFRPVTFVEDTRRYWKYEPEWRGFQFLSRDLANVNAWKTIFDRYYYIKKNLLLKQKRQENLRKFDRCTVLFFTGRKSAEYPRRVHWFDNAASRAEILRHNWRYHVWRSVLWKWCRTSSCNYFKRRSRFITVHENDD